MIVECDRSEITARIDSTARHSPRLAGLQQPDRHAAFMQMLPGIRRHAQVRFRHVNLVDREDAVQEVVTRAFVDYHRLVERGKSHLAYGSSLARYAVAQVRAGRRVGSRLNVQDVSSSYCQQRKQIKLESLDRRDVDSDDWRSILVEDRYSTPADIAAARIDVEHWLRTLPDRSRVLAERLASGEPTNCAARALGISAGRVSQLRRELKHAWQLFHGEATTAAT